MAMLNHCYAELLNSEHNYVTVFSGFHGSYALVKLDCVYFIIANSENEITAYLPYNLTDTFKTDASEYTEFIKAHQPTEPSVHNSVHADAITHSYAFLDDELDLNNDFVIKQGYLETILLHKYNGVIYEIRISWGAINSYSIVI